MWMHDGGWGWSGVVMMLLMLAFWAAVIWGVVTVVRGARDRAVDGDPEQVLGRRFAAGEIDEDEYRRRLETLRSERVDGSASWRHRS